MKNSVSFGLALSGGGVKGLAHIGLLKAIDTLGLTPSYISGTSMGAIIGALYASGLKADEIENRVRQHIVEKGSKAKQIYKNRKNLLKWSRVFSFEKQSGGFFAADGLFEHLFSELVDLDFADLNIPFSAVATNFYTGAEVELKSGEVLPAVKASMAVPGVFAPVKIRDATLIDGGLVNNLPVKQIQHCKTRIASDVITLPKIEESSKLQTPKVKRVLTGSLSIMIHNASQTQLEKYPCSFLHEVNTNSVDTFDFFKIEESLNLGDKAALNSIEELKRLLIAH